MLRDIEVVTVNVRTAGFGVGPPIGALLGQLVGIDFLQSLDNLFAILDFKAEMIQARWAIVARGSAESPD